MEIDRNGCWNWSKLAWLSLTVPITFLFFFIILNVGDTLSTATSSRGVIALYAAAIFAWFLTVAAWLYFRRLQQNADLEPSDEDLEPTLRP